MQINPIIGISLSKNTTKYIEKSAPIIERYVQ